MQRAASTAFSSRSTAKNVHAARRNATFNRLDSTRLPLNTRVSYRYVRSPTIHSGFVFVSIHTRLIWPRTGVSSILDPHVSSILEMNFETGAGILLSSRGNRPRARRRRWWTIASRYGRERIIADITPRHRLRYVPRYRSPEIIC